MADATDTATTDAAPPAADTPASELASAPAEPTPQASVETQAEPPDAPEVSVGDFFGTLYRITYSKTLGLIVILAMAVLVLIGVLITQAPAGTYSDAAAKATFLASMSDKYGGWTNILNLLGFFHVFSSIGFYVVVGALAVSITGCTTHRIPQLWQRWRHPRVLMSDRFYESARYHGSAGFAGSDAAALEVATERLQAARYRVVRGNDTNLYADKFAWGGFGTVAAHLSFIIILAGFVVSGVVSYQAVLNVPVGGAPAAVGQGTNLSVSAADFEATFDDSGQPLDYVSHLVLHDGDAQVAEQDIRVNTPLTYKGWRFHQDSYGLAMDMSVVDSGGATLFSGSVAQQWTTEDGTLVVGRFTIPERGLTIDVLGAASGVVSADLQPGQVAVLLYRDGESEAMAMQILDQGVPVDIGDIEITFNRETEFTGILVRRDPGAALMWIGSVLLVGGMMTTFLARHRRLWVRAQDGKLLLASADAEDSGFRADFDQLVTQSQNWFSSEEKPS